MSNTYSYGLPFSEKVGENIDDLLQRIDNRKASLLICDGLMGEGKTTLAIEMAQYIALKREGVIHKVKDLELDFYDDFKVDIDKQLAMGGEQFQEKLEICKDCRLHVVVYDEAGDFSKKGAITQFNQKLMRVFQTFRAFKILVILALPSFDILENDLFKQGVPRILFNCHDRGDWQGSIRGYGLEEMFYLKHYMKKEVVPFKAYSKVKPNFRGHFLDLPKKISDKLDEVSTNAKEEVLSTNILKNRGLLNYGELASRVGRSPFWIRRTLKELKIEPKLKHKLKNYYEASILEVLEAQKGNNS